MTTPTERNRPAGLRFLYGVGIAVTAGSIGQDEPSWAWAITYPLGILAIWIGSRRED